MQPEPRQLPALDRAPHRQAEQSEGDAPQRDIGVATAASQFFRNVGATVGVAVLGTVMNSGLREAIVGRLPAGAARGASDIDTGNVLDPAALATLPPAVTDAVRQGLAEQLHEVFLWGLPITGLALVCALAIRVVPLRMHLHDEPVEVAPEAA